VIPYLQFSYFLLLLYPLVALTLLGLFGRLGRSVVLVVSVAVVFVQYGEPVVDASSLPRQLVFLCAYAAASIAIVLGYSFVLRRSAAPAAFRAAVALVLLPIVAVKVHPLISHSVLQAVGPRGAAAAIQEPPGVPRADAGLFDTFGFLGMSYMALRVLDVIIALRDGAVRPAPRVADLVSYLLFVPTISAGPVDRFRRFTEDLDALPRPGRAYLDDLEAGVHRIAQGFLYKFIIAYLIHREALRPLADRPGIGAVIEYMYAYSLYLFFDFAGYSAFAIGVGRFFGIHVPENFNAPFLARNFRDMWNRWHISLSWWLRDHVYMRFVLHATRRKWFGGNHQWAHAAGLLLTMGLMGCWHGLEPRYLVYGLYQGLMLVAYDVAGSWSRRHGIVADGRLARVASVFATVNLFCFGLLIFSGRLFR
jgi:membrane protein involved in D-alanine export